MNNRTDRDAVLDELVQRQQEKDLEKAEVDAERREAERRPPLLARGPVVAALTLIFVSVVIWDVRALKVPVPVPTAVEAETSARMMLAVASLQVEAFRQAQGRLPLTLEEANAPTEGLSYLPSGATYFLQAVAGDNTVTLDDEVGPEGLLEGIAEVAQGSGR